VAYDPKREELLEATLKEFLRINRAAKKDPESIPPEEALEGILLRQWKNMERKARQLVNVP
jgi:hypothetical protein